MGFSLGDFIRSEKVELKEITLSEASFLFKIKEYTLFTKKCSR